MVLGALGIILIISEANLKNTSKNLLPPFKFQYSSKGLTADNNPSFLCLSKTPFIKVQRLRKTSDRNRKILDLVLLKINSVYILTGYASPKFPKVEFIHHVRKIATNVPPNNDFILIGDFNHDNLLLQNRNMFENMLPNGSLTSALENDAITTTYGSQLDIIYTNIKFFNAHVYSTHYSDHDPIYLQIPLETID